MRLRRWLTGLVVVVAVGFAAFWILTEPRPLAASVVPTTPGDATRGELVFWAGGCVSCHLSPDAKASDAKPMLGGGKALTSKFGTFFPPNISPDKDTGIGNWTMLDFLNAMKRGIGPGGTHLYPSFPYTSYQRMPIADLVDLKAFLDTLPPVHAENKPDRLPFPLNIRRGLGLWKFLFLDGREFAADATKSAEVNRGAYLVNGPGHCNECHTPRTLFGLGGLDMTHALGGAPNLSGRGRAPNLTPGTGGIGDKSADDLLFDLEMGQDFNGVMLEVQQNLAHLPESDLAAIVAYLKQVAPVNGPPRRQRPN
ncbi:MAG TPA: cytochrome c [Bauldia sp.]|nr:cytochrome c [Bauldia sp.]